MSEDFGWNCTLKTQKVNFTIMISKFLPSAGGFIPFIFFGS
jgi:hypothetical protein